jgi:Porin subfamily
MILTNESAGIPSPDLIRRSEMNFALRVLLGSIVGAGLIGAEAADLPANKAVPADYAKVCNVGGMAGFVLPGSETCVKISGFVSGGIAAGELKTGPHWTAAPGALAAPYPGSSARTAFGSIEDFSIDMRQDTPYGVMRGYAEGRFNNYAGFNDPAAGATINRAFVQYGGFTVGKANSFFPFFSR